MPNSSKTLMAFKIEGNKISSLQLKFNSKNTIRFEIVVNPNDLKSKEMSKKSNVKIHFTDSTILNLRALIDLDYVGESIYTYHTVIFLNDEYIKQLSTKKVAYFELYHFKTILSGRKGNNLFDYLRQFLISNPNHRYNSFVEYSSRQFP